MPFLSVCFIYIPMLFLCLVGISWNILWISREVKTILYLHFKLDEMLNHFFLFLFCRNKRNEFIYEFQVMWNHIVRTWQYHWNNINKVYDFNLMSLYHYTKNMGEGIIFMLISIWISEMGNYRTTHNVVLC